MAIRISTARLLCVVLGAILLFALLPMPNHMSTMQAMGTDMVSFSQYDLVQGNVGDNSTESCCDAIGSFLIVCDFMVFSSACVGPYGGSERVETSVAGIQSIYIEDVSPP